MIVFGKGLERTGFGLAAVATLLAAPMARAESLYLVAGDAKAMNLIDMDSVKRSGDLSRVQEAVAYGAPADKVYTARTQLEFDCKQAKVRTVSTTTFGADDATLETSAAAGDWQEVAAGSTMATYARFACGRGRPDPTRSMDDKLAAIAKTYRTAVANGKVR